MKLSIQRAHIWYENSELKGPLKGVNMPIKTLMSWRGTVNDITVLEKLVFDIVNSNEMYEYLICCINGDSSTILHEWCHAYYFFDEEYRTKCQSLWESLDLPLKQHITKELEMRKYTESVFVDEFQAYVREDPGGFGKKWTSTLKMIHSVLLDIIKMPVLVPVKYDSITYNFEMPPIGSISY